MSRQKRFIAIIVSILLLAGCTNNDATVPDITPIPDPISELSIEWSIEPQDTDFSYYHVDFTINIAPARDNLLAAFEYIHEMDYYELRGVADGDRLVIWADVPLSDFAVIDIRNDFIGDEWVWLLYGSYGRVDSLLPGQGYVISNYLGMGTLPWSGLSFIDENDQRHYFFMQHDQSDSPNVFILGSIEVAEGE